MRTIKRRRPGRNVEIDFWTRLGNHLAQFPSPQPADADVDLVTAALGERFKAELAAKTRRPARALAKAAPRPRPRKFKARGTPARGRR